MTGEHSCIMICSLNTTNYNVEYNWLPAYYRDFRRRLMKLLGKSFTKFSTGLCLSLLEHKAVKLSNDKLTDLLLNTVFLPHDIQRLESYCRNQVEYRLILDLTSDLAMLYFNFKLSNSNIDSIQKVKYHPILFKKFVLVNKAYFIFIGHSTWNGTAKQVHR